MGYLLLTRLWQLPAGMVTMWLLLKFYSEEFRDNYYLFTNLLALQTFVELGLPTILIILASHEWAHLQLDPAGSIAGDSKALSRLASLDRFSTIWFRCCAAILFFGVGSTGWWMAHQRAPADLIWQLPWAGAVLMNAISLLYLPRLAILEGCNQMLTINFFRASQAVVGSFVVWACLGSGAGLWSLVAANAVRCMWDVYLVTWKYRHFYQSLNQADRSVTMNWLQEVWPLQWRLSLQSVAGYFSNSFFVPVLYQFGRPGESGQFGMTWSILSSLQQTSLSWLHTRTPELAALAAKRDLPRLERRMLITGSMTVTAFLLGACAFWWFLWGLQFYEIKAANGFLSLPILAWLIAALTIVQVILVQHTYVRIHKQDPYVYINTISAAAVGGLVWWSGKNFQAQGVAIAYTTFALLWSLPASLIILGIYRRRFYQEAESLRSESSGEAAMD